MTFGLRGTHLKKLWILHSKTWWISLYIISGGRYLRHSSYIKHIWYFPPIETIRVIFKRLLSYARTRKILISRSGSWCYIDLYKFCKTVLCSTSLKLPAICRVTFHDLLSLTCTLLSYNFFINVLHLYFFKKWKSFHNFIEMLFPCETSINTTCQVGFKTQLRAPAKHQNG